MAVTLIHGLNRAVIGGLAVALAVSTFGPPAAAAGTAASAARPGSATPAVPPAAETSESARAAATGTAVEVASLRDEYTTTFAKPDGTFRVDMSSAPVRARDAAGNWTAPDATLARMPDGSLAPRAALVDLRFSGGGGQAMVSMRDGARRMELGWTGPLPTPILDGPTATYPNVLPDVDLRLTASVEGFRQVIVVKTAEAAKNPALTRIGFPVDAHGLTVRGTTDGGFKAYDASGAVVFTGPGGAMWDSRRPPAGATARARTGQGTDGSDVSARGDLPGEAARVSPLKTRYTPDLLTIDPPASVLQDPATVYPVYIDPPIGINQSAHTMIRSDGSESWNYSGDEGMGKCGTLTIGGVSYYCGTGFVSRLLFQFSGSKLSGKHVLDATFRAYEKWSFTCTPEMVDLYRVNGTISSSTSWPGPSAVDKLVDRTASAGRGTLCSPEQPDAWIEFNDNPAETDENLTSTVRNLANGTWSNLALELRANDETDTAAWKRFRGDAVLQVTYVPKPGLPKPVGVRTGSSPSLSCSTNSASPTTVTTLTPIVGATVQTLVQPATGEERGQLAAKFRIFSGTSTTPVWTSPTATTGWVADGSARALTSPKLTEGTTYRMEAQTQSHYSGGNLFGPWSADCWFRPVTTAPGVSTVTPTGTTVYSECTDTSCTADGGTGTAGSFQLRNPMLTTSSFAWSVVSDGVQTASGTTNATTSGTSRVASITVTPQLEGVHTLTVTANNPAGPGAPMTYDFRVAPGSAPVGRWQVADATTPGAGAGTAGALTLSSATVSPLGRRAASEAAAGGTDSALDFNATTSAARTASPAVDTSQSFTVAAWVHLRTSPGSGVIAYQGDGPNGAGMDLYYSPSHDKYVFAWSYVVGGTRNVVRAFATTAAPPKQVWTHVAGVYDATGKTIELYVNGVPQGKLSVSSTLPTATTGPLIIGHSDHSAATSMGGLIDEAAVWNRALTAAEMKREIQTLSPTTGAYGTALVGSWRPALDGSLADTSGYGRPPLVLAGTAQSVTGRGIVLDGTSGAASTTGPLVDEGASFTVAARISGMIARTTGKGRVVSQTDAAGTGTSWSLYYDYATTQWKFTRTGTSSTGTAVSATASSGPMPVDPEGDIVVTGIYDAKAKSVQVYVMLAGQCSTGCSAAFSGGQGSGAVTVGRARSGTSLTDYLGGGVGWLRIWSGAVSENDLGGVIYGE